MRRWPAIALLVVAVALQRAAHDPELARAIRDFDTWRGASAGSTSLLIGGAGATFLGAVACAMLARFGRARFASPGALSALALAASVVEAGAHVQRSSNQVEPAVYIAAFAAGLFAPSAFAMAAEIILPGRAFVLAGYAVVAHVLATVVTLAAWMQLEPLHRENSARAAGHIAFVGAACVVVAGFLAHRRAVAAAGTTGPRAGPYREASSAADTSAGAREASPYARMRAVLTLGGAAVVTSLVAVPPPVESWGLIRDLAYFSTLGVVIGSVGTLVVVIVRGRRESPGDRPMGFIAVALGVVGFGAMLGAIGAQSAVLLGCFGVFVVGLGTPAALAVSTAYVAAAFEPPRRSLVIALLFGAIAIAALASAVLVALAPSFTNAKFAVLLRIAEGLVALVGAVFIFVRRRTQPASA